MRKHIDTMSQVINLKGNELDILANFMGHDVRIHKCQGKTMSEIVVSMARWYSDAYVAFSSLTSLEGLHIVSFDHQKIQDPKRSVNETDRFCVNNMTLIHPEPLVTPSPGQLIICHLNVNGLKPHSLELQTSVPETRQRHLPN
jgi:hypothetical protein